MGLNDPTIYVYQLIYDENDNNETKIIQYFIMHGLVLCIKVDIFMCHKCSMHGDSVTIKQFKYL